MPKEMQEQINALMGDSDELESDGEESRNLDESGEEERSEESEASEEGDEEQSSEEENFSEGEQDEDKEEGEESEESEEDESESDELATLRAEVDRLSALVEKSKSSEESEESATISEPEPVEIFDDKFNFEAVVENEDSFKEFINSLVKKVQSQTHQNILQSLPDTVASYVGQQMTVKDQVKDFYTTNPDLANTKQYVAVTANQVAAEHPEWGFDKVLEETATQVRKALGLKQETKKKESSNKQKKNPALAKGTKGQSSKKKPKPEISEMEKQILELMEDA